MKNFRKIAPCALSILMAVSATLLPLKSTNVFADDTSSPPTCKDGYEYVESVGKCYKKCQDGWERNSETNRCRKIRAEESKGETKEEIKEELKEEPKEETKEAPKEESKTEVKAEASKSTKSTSSSASNSAKPSSFQEAATTCKEGYEYVESVGKCYKECADGWERNPETNRCRKAAVESDYEATTNLGSGSGSTTKNSSGSKSSKTSSTTCKEGYEYVESAGKCYKACAEGQIRNPETNRCKKDTTSSTESSTKSNSKSSAKKTNDGADYAVDVPNTGTVSSFTATGAVVALIVAGLIFVIFQYRVEIRQFIKKRFKKS